MRFCHFVKDSQESLGVFQQVVFKSPSEVRRRKLCFEIKKKIIELRKKHNLTQLKTFVRIRGFLTRRLTWFFNASSYVVFQRVVLRGFLYLFVRESLGIGGVCVI